MVTFAEIPLWMLFGAGALLLLIGVAAMLVALRRCVGDAPHCRKCGYALDDASLSRCPECGFEQGARGAKRGRRAPRRAVAFVGVALIAASIVPGTVGVLRVAGFDFYPHAPAGVVLVGAENQDDRALTELDARIASGAMDARAS